MEGSLISLAFFATIYGIVRMAFKKKERMAAIERGLNPANLETRENQTLVALKFGLVLIGVGTGILIASILTTTTTIEPGVANFSLICLGGGIALVLSYYLGKKITAEQEKEQKNQNAE